VSHLQAQAFSLRAPGVFAGDRAVRAAITLGVTNAKAVGSTWKGPRSVLKFPPFFLSEWHTYLAIMKLRGIIAR
jgi:hypothetical protein